MNKAQLREYRIKVYELLIEHFNEEELKTLCFYVGEDYESLPGKGKEAKARELVHLCQRKHLFSQLKDEVIKQRPHASWPDIPSSRSMPPLPSEPEPIIPGLSFRQTIGKRFKRIPKGVG